MTGARLTAVVVYLIKYVHVISFPLHYFSGCPLVVRHFSPVFLDRHGSSVYVSFRKHTVLDSPALFRGTGNEEQMLRHGL